MINALRTTLGISLLAALLAACTAAEPGGQPPADDGENAPPPAESAPLAGTAWTLTSIGGEPLIEGSNITLEFEADNLGGYGGCNSYGGQYTASTDGSLSAGELAQTDMACSQPEGVMQQEAAYLEQLLGATAYRIESDTLTIEGAGETLAYTRQQRSDADPAALVGTAWQLAAVNGEAPAEPYSIAFPAAGQMVARAACRVVVGTYTAEGDSIHFPNQSMAGEPCPDLAEAEGNFTDALSWASHYRLEGSQFELVSQRGETFTFEPVDAAPELAGTSWILLAFAGPDTAAASVAQALPEPPVTLSFEDGSATGSAGCNGYGGSYEQDGSTLTISEVVSTMMACADQDVMDQEARYLNALGEVTSFTALDDVLWLAPSEGTILVFTAAE